MIVGLSVVIALLVLVIVLMAFMRGGRPDPTGRPFSAQLDELEPHTEEADSLREEITTLRANHAAEIERLKAEAKAEFIQFAHEQELEYASKRRADRQSSNARSRKALVAKIAEHLAPLLEGFPYNFKDVRHIGELVDFIVYDGLEDGEIREVIFLEVKTSRTGRVSNPREVMLRAAIDAGRVSYQVFTPTIPPTPAEELPGMWEQADLTGGETDQEGATA
jgi:predicted Holliday junction resolvase-like endonuclease